MATPTPPRPVSLRTTKRLVDRPIANELAKAILIDTTTGVGHPVMYNPEELKLEQGNQFAEVGIPGLNASPEPTCPRVCSTGCGIVSLHSGEG